MDRLSQVRSSPVARSVLPIAVLGERARLRSPSTAFPGQTRTMPDSIGGGSLS
ncbi:hypothetical protein [Microcoleus sp. OTE_8_concoct_300]|uniref:hypothetical protein n=1 Tax=Microcoleus sp. OTE_8_concoct_300 TaxID=2964710 RepID=UPI00403F3473